VCSDYGVLNEQTGVPVRAIIIVDKEGLVRFSKIYKAASDLNPSDILSEVAKL
jgi:alkyl hydroperoxide reductase subunit AhpC